MMGLTESKTQSSRISRIGVSRTVRALADLRRLEKDHLDTARDSVMMARLEAMLEIHPGHRSFGSLPLARSPVEEMKGQRSRELKGCCNPTHPASAPRRHLPAASALRRTCFRLFHNMRICG